MLVDEYDPLSSGFFQILDEKGNIVNKKYEPKLSDSRLIELYRAMFLSRKVDNKAFKMQRAGKIGTFAQVAGQEAAQVGSTAVLQKQDWVIPAFRETASMIMHGLPIYGFFLANMGSEDGSKPPKGINHLPTAVPVGSQTLHAVGLAWAAKIKGDKVVTLAYFGDGATSEGECMEAMNFAGVFQTPTIFLCQNNQWAISVPRSQQTRAKTLAQKAIAFGFKGIQVDGNDVLAMYAATKEAVDNARNGNGPTLIEAVTYRLADHTTADDATLYRTDEEVKEWKKKDPLIRFRIYLENKKIWDKNKQAQLEKECETIINDAIKKAEEHKPELIDIFKYTYAEMTPRLKEQYEYLRTIEEQREE